ncbi:exopolysaccharide biosynthesis polyprenyl glycosylphosphotransferase [Clostridium sp. HBUAS56010]|uniref:exopolysaccharide biosynthesis polyprenyl glycosylphosphotransferase n=1 Tax=Clostridium sp. HBUAS56010 TaxID=2571127 RepID=UPI001178534A|nr:exopolysaccharide biosynthesis polyprenyl glycosylphosphotransferase [Clostridium sp. HBUAS56010]
MNQKEQFKRIIKCFFLATSILLHMIIFWIVWLQYYNSNIELPFFRKGNWLMASLYGALFFSFTNTYGGFKVGYLKKADIVYSQVLSTICVNAVTYLQICLLDRHFVNGVPLILLTFIQILIITIWTNVFQRFYSMMFPPKKMILVYGERSVFGLKTKIDTREDKYNICETVNIKKGMDYIFERLKGYEAVIIGDIPSQYRNVIMKYCFEKSIRTYLSPKISDIILRGSDDIHIFDTPLLLSRNNGFTFEEKFLKRITDIILSVLLLLITSPIMLITTILIKLYDGGTIIHRQTRLTMGGMEFDVYKFRSMIMNAEKDGIARLSAEGDVRITPIGKIIRRTRIDELPQLFNILKGEMSLVGPRPERPQIAAEYREYMPEFDYRLKVKGGLTGYAQIYGKYNTTPYDKLKMDLMYIENHSFLLDLKLILMTLKVIFMKDSTEGIAEGQTTATLVPGEYSEEDKNITG